MSTDTSTAAGASANIISEAITTAETIFTTTVPITYYDPRRQMKVTEPMTFQHRNEIRFRNYQKFGAEVKIIEDIGDFEDEPEPEKKP